MLLIKRGLYENLEQFLTHEALMSHLYSVVMKLVEVKFHIRRVQRVFIKRSIIYEVYEAILAYNKVKINLGSFSELAQFCLSFPFV